MKRCLVFSVIIFILIPLIGCKKWDEAEMQSEQLCGIQINNHVDINSRNVTEYNLSELNNYFGEYSSQEKSVFNIEEKQKEYSMEIVNSTFPIQILRHNQNNYYSVYRVSDGGFFYVFWDRSNSGVFVSDTFYLYELKDKSDFSDLQIGKSSYADVYEIDQASELMLLLSNGVYSYSLLENNDLLKIKYTFNDINGRNDLIIESIDVVSTKNGKVRSYNPFWIKIYHEHISTQL